MFTIIRGHISSLQQMQRPMLKNILMIKIVPAKEGTRSVARVWYWDSVLGCGVEGGANYVVESQLVFSQEGVRRYLKIHSRKPNWSC